MKYVLTGSLGHISKPVATNLIAAGHDVTIITTNSSKTAEIEKIGATAAVGSVDDASFINKAFAGADAVYLMIPPKWDVQDWLAYQTEVADNYVNAITSNAIGHIVMLSSIGAQMGTGAGPIDGLAVLESKLKNTNAAVKALRPSYFFYNLHAQKGLVDQAGIMGANFGTTDEKLVLTHTDDIADIAFQTLNELKFTGFSVQHISSDERYSNDIAKVLGTAIGKPELPWVTFEDEQSFGGMTQAGLSSTIASGYVQMGKSIREGKLQEEYWKDKNIFRGKVKLEDFAKEWASAFKTVEV